MISSEDQVCWNTGYDRIFGVIGFAVHFGLGSCLPGCWLHLSFRGHLPYLFRSDDGSCSELAPGLLQANVWQFPTYPRRRIPFFLPFGIKVSCVDCVCAMWPAIFQPSRSAAPTLRAGGIRAIGHSAEPAARQGPPSAWSRLNGWVVAYSSECICRCINLIPANWQSKGARPLLWLQPAPACSAGGSAAGTTANSHSHPRLCFSWPRQRCADGARWAVKRTWLEDACTNKGGWHWYQNCNPWNKWESRNEMLQSSCQFLKFDQIFEMKIWQETDANNISGNTQENTTSH